MTNSLLAGKELRNRKDKLFVICHKIKESFVRYHPKIFKIYRSRSANEKAKLYTIHLTCILITGVALFLDQDRQFVGPDLGPECLQRLSEGKNIATSHKSF